jgi:hypothetical protein
MREIDGIFWTAFQKLELKLQKNMIVLDAMHRSWLSIVRRKQEVKYLGRIFA